MSEAISQIVDETLDEKSEATIEPEDLIKAELELEGENNEEVANESGMGKVPVDSSGVLFDADIHTVDSDGNPKLTLTGKFRKKKLKREPLKKVVGGTTVKDCKATAAVTVDAIGFVTTSFLGPDWHFQTDEKNKIDERSDLVYAFENYYKHKGISDIPPGAVVVVALMTYASRRVTTPTTKSRIKAIYTWIASKFTRKAVVNGT